MTFSKIIFLVKNLKNVFFITKNLIALDKIWEKFAKTFALTVSANVIPVFLIYPIIKRGMVSFIENTKKLIFETILEQKNYKVFQNPVGYFSFSRNMRTFLQNFLEFSDGYYFYFYHFDHDRDLRA